MSVETEIRGLTSAVNDLKTSVDFKKAELDATVQEARDTVVSAGLEAIAPEVQRAEDAANRVDLGELDAAKAATASDREQTGSDASRAEAARTAAESAAARNDVVLDAIFGETGATLDTVTYDDLSVAEGAIARVARNGGLYVMKNADATDFDLIGAGGVKADVSLDNFLSPRMFKEGVGIGIEENDTDALEAAWGVALDPNRMRTAAITGDNSAGVQKGPVIFLPDGVLHYGGTGLERGSNQSAIVAMRGASRESTQIRLASGSRLIDTPGGFVSAMFEEFQVLGGKGIYRGRFLNVNTGAGTTFRRMRAAEYSVCAIEDNSQDNPYFRVSDLQLWGSKDHDTIGVALAGYRANSYIMDSVFLRNRYHLKLAVAQLDGPIDKGPAVPINIQRNDFIRYLDRQDNGKGVNCYDVWAVPNAKSADNAGRGILFHANKFGNEGLQNGDAKLLIADEGAGEYVGDKHHSATASTGYVNGVCMSHDNVNFKESVDSHLILSYTPRLFNFDIDPIWDNNAPEFVAKYHPGASLNTFDKQSANNRVSFARGLSFSQGVVTPRLSNEPGTWRVSDPFGYAGDKNADRAHDTRSRDLSYVTLLQTKINAFNKSSATSAAITSGAGVPNEATEVTMTGAGGRIAASLLLANVIEGQIATIRTAIKRGSTNSVGAVRVRVADNSDRILFERTYRLEADWQPIELKFDMKTTNRTGLALRFEGIGFVAGTAETFSVDMTEMFHGKIARSGSVHPDISAANYTAVAGQSPRTLVAASPLTASRSVTLGAVANNGDKFRVVRLASATGAFNLSVGSGPLKTLTAGQWCEVEYDGSAWVLTAFGSL